MRLRKQGSSRRNLLNVRLRPRLQSGNLAPLANRSILNTLIPMATYESKWSGTKRKH